MAAATAITYERGDKQFQGVFEEVWLVKATLDVASLADGAGSSDTVAVPGVELGDMVLGISFAVDQAGVTITGYVSTAGTVTLRVQNESAGVVDLASTTVKLLVGRPSW